MLARAWTQAQEFDIIHFHTDCLQFPLLMRYPLLHVTTVHGALDVPDHASLHTEYSDMPLLSISNAQRTPLPNLNWRATVHHGLPESLYAFHQHAEDCPAFVGRIALVKRVDRAIEIARRSGMKLRIAANVDDADRNYFSRDIKSLLNTPGAEFIGEIGEGEKGEFIGNAYALLFPIDWTEPFGMVMIEALACGTPIVAYRHGSVPEVIAHGETGFVVDNIDDAVRAVEQVSNLKRES